MTIEANVYGGQLTVDLTGTGLPAGAVSLTPSSIDFGQVQVGATSVPMQVQAGNSGGTAIPISSVAITAPFAISSNTCGTTQLAADSSCQILVEFAPTQPGAAAGTLTFTDGAGTQTVALSGTGAAAPTDTLNPSALSFPGTASGALTAAQTISLTNTGDIPLTAIGVSASGAFQTSNNCGTQLAGHAACTISVVFAPTQLGSPVRHAHGQRCAANADGGTQWDRRHGAGTQRHPVKPELFQRNSPELPARRRR